MIKGILYFLIGLIVYIGVLILFYNLSRIQMRGWLQEIDKFIDKKINIFNNVDNEKQKEDKVKMN
jgi:hypothetical protein